MDVPDFAVLVLCGVLRGLLLLLRLLCGHAADHSAVFLGTQEMGPHFAMNLRGFGNVVVSVVEVE